MSGHGIGVRSICYLFVSIVGAMVVAADGGVSVGNTVADWPEERTVCMPAPLGRVKVSGFLGRHVDRNVESILAALESPFIRGFEARAAGLEPPAETRRLAADSDLYKWLEGACYALAYSSDERLRLAVERVEGLILACRRDEGFINTQGPQDKWISGSNHDLYIAGHFFEAAVAHYRATGSRKLLDAASVWADFIISRYEAGDEYFKRVGDREHSEYELGFLRLGRTTGNRRYVQFAGVLARMCRVGRNVADIRAGGGLHAVRVGYLLSGWADLYLESGDEGFIEHLPGLWDELVDSRLYVTGGLGMVEKIPAEPFDLPHWIDHRRRDIAETCASVAMMMFSWRMHAMQGPGKYFDVIERILYNHYLGAVSLDHLGNFYYNPLRLTGDISGRTDHDGPKDHRCRLPAIHSTACCLPNCYRFFGALPEYVFSQTAEGVMVNLYTSAELAADADGIALKMITDYPNSGSVTVEYCGTGNRRFGLGLRIPGWCEEATIDVNGKHYGKSPGGRYFSVERSWRPGDLVELDLPMCVRVVGTDDRVKANRGYAGFAVGPLVYCLENADTDFPVEWACIEGLPEKAAGNSRLVVRGDLLDGVNVLEVPAVVAEPDKGNHHATITMIPFYARANRRLDNRWVTLLPVIEQ